MKRHNYKYQINKTLRFGLTLNQEAIAKPQKSESHQALGNLVEDSYEKLRQKCTNKQKWDEKQLLDDISKVINKIKNFQNLWKEFYHRYDQLAVTKDFYRALTKKARFEGFWNNEKGVKQPQSSIVKLSSLGSEYNNKKRYDYIIAYWKDNLNRQQKLLNDFEPLLAQYQNAIENPSHNHKKPNLINVSKSFLSLSNLVNEVLIPISDSSISFPNIAKITDEDEKLAKLADTDQWLALAQEIKIIKEILNEHGGYIPLGRVTLNPYTAKQKPQDFSGEINCLIKELKLKKLVEELKDKQAFEIEQYFKDLPKLQNFNDKEQSTIIKAQCFKYKPIPVLVRNHLTGYLAKNPKKDEMQIRTILDNIGKPKSVAQDYKENGNIDLKEYPIKVAFDYAWENLAKAQYAKNLDFPKEKCKEFLKDFYGIEDIEEYNDFKLYAKLLYIAENVATLEHSTPKYPQSHKDTIKKVFGEMDNDLPKKHKNDKNTILEAIKYHIKLKDNTKFQTAKMQLGQFRGGLKPKNFSNEFKTIASDFGKKLADLRDKFLERNEVTKINYFGIVIEDHNQDRYLLINPLEQENQERKDFVNAILAKLSDKEGDYNTYQVKSLTSKALQKIIANRKTYPNFHEHRAILTGKSKQFKDDRDDLKQLKEALSKSKMAQEQNWQEFGWDIETCKYYAAIEKEIDQKAYILTPQKISAENLNELIKGGALLLPIVNQDITSQSRQNKNQFSHDWAKIFNTRSKEYRLHPEFKINYRTPTPDYPTHKRFGRLQCIAHLNCEIIPQDTAQYVTRKEQLQLFNDQKEHNKYIEKFNKDLSLNDDYKVIGIDRGLKQLATLCVLDADGKINAEGFNIYTKEFDISNKQWVHILAETRHILDVSNLRVETTVAGQKVLVDQSLTKVKEHRNTPNETGTKENQQKIKLKQLAYIRKLQYAMQTQEQDVLDLLKPDNNNTEMSNEILEKRIKETKIISPYGEGENYADLPIATLREIITNFQKAVNDKNDMEKQEIIELDHADDLKRGIVANMVGVVRFILEQYHYKAYISLENLCHAWGGSEDGLSGRYLPPTTQDTDMDFKEQQNLMLAGLGTYQFFEVQLLRKLFKVKQQQNIQLIPPFRSVGNYEDISKLTREEGNEYVCKPFGIVHFVDPRNTSQKCPMCGITSKKILTRNNNILTCHQDKQDENNKKGCGFQTNTLSKDELNRHFIRNGDDNGAYHIALKTLKNLKKKTNHQ